MKNTERGVWGTQREELVHTHAMQRQSLPASLTSCFAVSRPKFHPPSAAPLLANDIGLFPEKVVPEGTVRRDGSKRGAAGGEGPYVDSLQTTRVRVRWLTLNSWCLWYSNRLAAAPTVRATNRASRQQRTRRGKRHSEPGFLVFWVHRSHRPTHRLLLLFITACTHNRPAFFFEVHDMCVQPFATPTAGRPRIAVIVGIAFMIFSSVMSLVAAHAKAVVNPVVGCRCLWLIFTFLLRPEDQK